jgi:O-antigen ligase
MVSQRVRDRLHPNGGSVAKTSPPQINPTRRIKAEFEAGASIALPAVKSGGRSLIPSLPRGEPRADWIFFGAFVLALAWCPFYFGGNAPLAWGIKAVLFPGLVAAYEATRLVSGRPHAVSLAYVSKPAILFLAVIAWTLVQNATWTPQSWHHPIWGMASDALDRPLEGSISVNRDETTLSQIRLVTSACAFWLSLQLTRHPKRADLFVKAIALIAAAYAAYGIVAFALFPGSVLWVSGLSSAVVTSTFINRNSFATYDGIGFLVICGLLLRLYHREALSSSGSMRLTIAALIEATGRGGALLLAGAALTLVALLLSGSRGGILSTGLGLFVLTVLMFSRRGARQSRQLVTLIFTTTLFVAVLAAFGDVFFGRVAEQGFHDETRMAVYKLALRSIFDAPLQGFGLGTFSNVFPMYRDLSISTENVWDKAHNDYLEVLQGLGLVFGAMLLAAITLLVWRCVEGGMTRRQNATIPCIAAGTGFLVGVHALADFSLQMQAVSLTFMAILGAGVAQATSSRHSLADD